MTDTTERTIHPDHPGYSDHPAGLLKLPTTEDVEKENFHFGCCPICGNAGKGLNDWIICETHMVCWDTGFVSHQGDEELWKANAEILERYTLVNPAFTFDELICDAWLRDILKDHLVHDYMSKRLRKRYQPADFSDCPF